MIIPLKCNKEWAGPCHNPFARMGVPVTKGGFIAAEFEHRIPDMSYKPEQW
jgi:hypothetical protein